MLLLKAQLGVLVQVALFAVLLYVPAGTFYWPRAAQFLVVYWVIVAIASVFLTLLSPAGVQARLEAPASDKQAPEDRMATVFLVGSMLGWMAFIPLDVFHLHLFGPPSIAVAAAGAVLGIVGLLLTFATIYTNQFVAPIVRDQSERGHRVVSSGPYAIVRHPMYTGFLLLFAGMGLWLESYASILLLAVVVAALVKRIRIEEKTLADSLQGYTDYSGKVRYRLVPGIW